MSLPRRPLVDDHVVALRLQRSFDDEARIDSEEGFNAAMDMALRLSVSPEVHPVSTTRDLRSYSPHQSPPQFDPDVRQLVDGNTHSGGAAAAAACPPTATGVLMPDGAAGAAYALSEEESVDEVHVATGTALTSLTTESDQWIGS